MRLGEVVKLPFRPTDATGAEYTATVQPLCVRDLYRCVCCARVLGVVIIRIARARECYVGCFPFLELQHGIYTLPGLGQPARGGILSAAQTMEVVCILGALGYIVLAGNRQRRLPLSVPSQAVVGGEGTGRSCSLT